MASTSDMTSAAAVKCSEDPTLEKWTFVRFAVLGSILIFRAWRIRVNGRDEADQLNNSPYRENPKLTKLMNESNAVLALVIAMCLFAQSEGVGLVIYFCTSAALDNYTIYFASSSASLSAMLRTEICEYVMQVALYSMAIITFLPCCIVAYLLQGRCYDRGQWLGAKTLFIIVMFVTATTSFIIRMYLVYMLGWDAAVERMLTDSDFKVLIAVLTPPVVDALQTVMLIGAAVLTKVPQHEADYQTVDQAGSTDDTMDAW